MSFDLAQLRGANQRAAIFFGEGRGNEDLKVDLVDHAGDRVGMAALHDVDSVRVESALLAEAKDVDSGARRDRGEEQLERRRRTGGGRLVGRDGEIAEVGIDPGAAGEIEPDFHR